MPYSFRLLLFLLASGSGTWSLQLSSRRAWTAKVVEIAGGHCVWAAGTNSAVSAIPQFEEDFNAGSGTRKGPAAAAAASASAAKLPAKLASADDLKCWAAATSAELAELDKLVSSQAWDDLLSSFSRPPLSFVNGKRVEKSLAAVGADAGVADSVEELYFALSELRDFAVRTRLCRRRRYPPPEARTHSFRPNASSRTGHFAPPLLPLVTCHHTPMKVENRVVFFNAADRSQVEMLNDETKALSKLDLSEPRACLARARAQLKPLL